MRARQLEEADRRRRLLEAKRATQNASTALAVAAVAHAPSSEGHTKGTGAAESSPKQVFHHSLAPHISTDFCLEHNSKQDVRGLMLERARGMRHKMNPDSSDESDCGAFDSDSEDGGER